ncbi:hypothetical protein D3C87_1768500 [compost metagenome]
MSCPSAKPTKNSASVSWAEAVLAPSSRAMVGRLGRYMSMDMGPMAVRAPRRGTRPRRAVWAGALRVELERKKPSILAG